VRFVCKTNIFSLAFSANNTHLYWYAGLDSQHPYILTKMPTPSGTTGRKLYKYDLAMLENISEFPGSPIEVFDDHTDTIRDLTCHPWQSELTMTAR
jgi:hypothetical protein